MKEFELFSKSGKSTGIWACGECRKVKPSEDWAKECCRPRVCKACEQEYESQYTTMICDSCRRQKAIDLEKERFEKAEKVDVIDGAVYCPQYSGYNEGFFTSCGDLFDEYENDNEGERLEYVYAVTEVSFVKIDSCDLFERLYDDAYEDWTSEMLRGVDELDEAIALFCERNKDQIRYEIDYSKARILEEVIIGK